MEEQQSLSSAVESGQVDLNAPATEGASPSGSDGAQAPGQPQEIDSLDRYVYQGQPLKEWQSAHMRYQDYTQKSQAIAQERRYYDNLSVDLSRVRQDPSLAEQFKSIYPEKFHAYLDYVTNSAAPRQPGQSVQPTGPQAGQPSLPPEFLAEWKEFKAQEREREVTAINSQIDQTFNKFTPKFPFAPEEAVLARASAYFAKKKEMNPGVRNLSIEDKEWEQIFKSLNDQFKGLAENQYKKTVESQLQAHKKGSDVGGGGGVPGQAPRQFKNIKEASEALRKEIEYGSV